MDIQLNYITKGTGKPLILLHGNGENHAYFVHQIEYFSRNYTVIALDTRGHGKSLCGEKPFTIKQFAENLHDFLLEKNITKAHILGFSDGGNIALTFALKYPEFVDCLILNGANLFPAGVKRSVQIPIEIGYHLASFWAEKSEKAKKRAEMLGLMVNEPNIDPQELEKIKVKTLVIAGTKDMILETHTRMIAEKIPGASLAFIGGDHFIANKNPNEFNKVGEEFLFRRKEGAVH